MGNNEWVVEKKKENGAHLFQRRVKSMQNDHTTSLEEHLACLY